MAKNQETINNKLENFLRAPERRYNPSPLDSSGNPVVGTEAEAFQFDFVKDDTNYGPVTVTLDGINQVIVYFGDKVKRSPKKPLDGSESWFDFIKALSRWAFTNGLTFDLEDDSNLGSDMAKRAHKQKMNEGYYPMGKKASYSDNVPTTKMLIQHSKVMEEGEQRFRHIEKIFVENASGERFLLPTNKPGLGRVYARHISEGGTPYDERGKHITGLVEEYDKMAGFVRATRNGQFNESAQKLIAEGIGHYQKLRETLHKMSGKKGYNTYFESWTPALMENEEQVDVSEMFMTSSLDPRIESVMPILGKLSKNINETKLKQVDELAEWAESIIQGDQAVDEGFSEDDNFTSDDINRLAQIKDFATLKAQAKELVKGKPARRMKPEKIAYFYDKIDTLTSPMKVIKLMYDLLLAGEGLKTIGSKNSMDPNHYQKRFGDLEEQDVAEGTYNKDVERAFPDGKASGVKTGASAPKGTSTMPKDKDKAKGQPAGALSEMDKSQPSSDRGGESSGNPYAKGGKATPVKSKDVVKQGAKALDKAMNKSHPDYSKHEKKLISKMSNAEKADKGWRNPNVEEGLDADQKSAGQLGPTEKVTNNNQGKLVGASESIDPLLRLKDLLGK